MKKITRNEIDKNNMVALGYCQCQTILDMFGHNYKIGYNSGVYGWNYDLYHIGNTDIVTGYSVPYSQCCNKEVKEKLINLENMVLKMEYLDIQKNKNELKKEFFEIFK